MQMQQLRDFLAVVEHGGFTRAAQQLGRTQQAVSKALRLLEEDVGVRLLDREAGALVALAVSGFEWQRPVTLAYRAGATSVPAVLAMIRALHEIADIEPSAVTRATAHSS